MYLNDFFFIASFPHCLGSTFLFEVIQLSSQFFFILFFIFKYGIFSYDIIEGTISVVPSIPMFGDLQLCSFITHSPGKIKNTLLDIQLCQHCLPKELKCFLIYITISTETCFYTLFYIQPKPHSCLQWFYSKF